MKELDESVSQLEQSYRASADPSTLNSIVSQRDEYNTILSAQVCKQLDRIKQKKFEIGDKPQKLLSRQLRQAQASQAILKIKSDTGTVLTDPIEINNRFMEFYSKLYKSSGNHDPDAIKSFLSELNLPHLNRDAVEELDKEIS